MANHSLLAVLFIVVFTSLPAAVLAGVVSLIVARALRGLGGEPPHVVGARTEAHES
jgi:hypothetical protein